MNKSALRVAGCVMVVLAFLVLLWMPTRPWINLQVYVPNADSPLGWSASGYELLLTLDGVVAGTKMLARLASEATTATDLMSTGGLLMLMGVPATSLAQIRALAMQTDGIANTTILAQILFFALPMLSIFMAVMVAASQAPSKWLMVRSGLLLGFVLLSALSMVGVMVVASAELDQLIGQPEIQNAINGLSVGGLRLDLSNGIGAVFAFLAGLMAIAGAALAVFGSRPFTAKSNMQAAAASHVPQQANQAASPAALNKSAAPSAVTVAPTQLPPPPPSPIAPSASRICATCGRSLPAAARFCNGCGSKLS
jgi:hypothetical protein